jgi:hypothetical protein
LGLAGATVLTQQRGASPAELVEQLAEPPGQGSDLGGPATLIIADTSKLGKAAVAALGTIYPPDAYLVDQQWALECISNYKVMPLGKHLLERPTSRSTDAGLSSKPAFSHGR